MEEVKTSPIFTIPQGEEQSWRNRLLAWAATHPYAAFFDSCGWPGDRYARYEWLIGVAGSDAQVFQQWNSLPENPSTWLMGALPYELRHQFEPKLPPGKSPQITWPEAPFFVPQTVIWREKGSQTLHINGIETDLSAITPNEDRTLIPENPAFKGGFSRDSYLQTIEQIREYIREGDFYEFNLTQGFSANSEIKNPAGLFARLRDISPVPFAAFFRFEDRYLLCASPERFLQLDGRQMIAQPMKGTARRDTNPRNDKRLARALRKSKKEQAENVMIVDLTRNDLNRVAKAGSVSVPGLFEVQTFPQVHQMISTIKGRLEENNNWKDLIRATFPPGSMTGAPKFRVMQRIEELEPEGRGIYAGSIGYVRPGGDFDFNVIIRSLVYQALKKQISYHVGGAITYDSDPATEYEEAILKAQAIRKLWKA